MPTKKRTSTSKSIQIPFLSGLVRSASKEVGLVVRSANKASNRIPVFGSVKRGVEGAVGSTNRFINGVPVVGYVKKGVTRGVKTAAGYTPLLANSIRGVKNSAGRTVHHKKSTAKKTTKKTTKKTPKRK
jgi:hypothetical protein